MKKFIYQFISLLSLLAFIFFFSGCVKDNITRIYTYSYYLPVYKTTAEVKANIKSNSPQEIVNPGKIVLLGNYIFLNEVDKGIHVIDNSNSASPRNTAFIDIPGNMDLALKGNTLYADLYTDLVTLDISDPLNVVVKKYNEGVFPYRYYGYGFYNDSTRIITDWIKHDTTITEKIGNGNGPIYPQAYYMNASALSSSNGANNSGSPIGKGGSMARFAIINNYLYTVDESDLNIFDITNTNNPAFSNKFQVDYHVETIYPFENKLFIGSNNGMFIYNIETNPANPTKMGEFTHARGCDPVIADGQFAFITLHSGTTCLGFNNELDVVKLNDLVDASLVKIYNLTSPQGLSKDGNLLFICDGSDGLKIYDAADVNNLKLVKQFSNIETYDVIAYNHIALVVAKNGLYQYDYSDANNIHLISKIGISKSRS
jgi:hypothetical protein